MKRIVWGLALMGLWVQGMGAAASDVTGNLNVIFAAKTLDENDWEPVDQHSEFGLHADFRPVTWPVNLAVAYFKSESDDEPLNPFVDAKLETTELQLGLRKIWEAQAVRPFIGGGVTLVDATLKISAPGFSSSESHSGTGYWVGAGLYWTIAEHLNIGVEGRLSAAEAEDAEVGGTHLGLMVGYHF